jgi:hypothetical protein
MTRSTLVLGIAAALVLGYSAGCDSPSKKTAANKKVQLRETLKKTTQRVFELQAELAKGAVVSTAKIENYDPLSGPGQAYVKITGQLGTMAVQQAIEMYNIQNDGYPKTFDEFMTSVLKVGQPDGIQLPERPFYQEYAYDVPNHQLVVLEYPDRKAQYDEQTREEHGRVKLPGQ